MYVTDLRQIENRGLFGKILDCMQRGGAGQPVSRLHLRGANVRQYVQHGSGGGTGSVHLDMGAGSEVSKGGLHASGQGFHIGGGSHLPGR